jgi:hypothetical protein
MRFDRHSRRTPTWSRQDQMRIVRLVGMLVLVLVLIQLAARPESWEWWTTLTQPQEPSAVEAVPADERPAIPLRRPATEPSLPMDTVYARVEKEPGGEEPSASSTATEAAAGPQSLPETTPQVPPRGTEEESPPDDQPDASGRLPDSFFTGVQNDWFGLTRGEQPALVRISEFLRTVDPAWLEARADRTVTFDVLLNNPEYYRGRPVAIQGTLRRLLAGQFFSEKGPVAVWEAYIVAPDSRNTPYLVFCNEVPGSMPRGDNLQEPVHLNAYFVRRVGYATARGEAVTSLLIAPTLSWRPMLLPSREAMQREMSWGALIFVGGMAVLVAGVLIWFFRSDRWFRHSRLHEIAQSRLDVSADELGRLAELDGGDPHHIRIDESADSAATRAT